MIKNTLKIFIIGISATIMVYLSIILNLWQDEMYTLNTTSRSLFKVIGQAMHFESQAPLYFFLLRMWRYINYSVWFSRFFSVISILSCFFILPKLSNQWLGKGYSEWILPLCVFNPFLIWAGVEIRVYALALLMSCLLLLSFHHGFLTSQNSKHFNRRLNIVLFGLISILSIYIQYFLGFYLVAFFIILLIEKQWKSISIYTAVMIFVGFSIIPLLMQVQVQVENHTKINIIEIINSDIFRILKEMVIRIENYIFSLYAFPRFLRYLVRIVFGVLIIIVIFIDKSVPQKHRDSKTQTNRLLIIIGTLLSFWFLVRIITRPDLMMMRHTYFIFFPIILFFIDFCRRLLWRTNKFFVSIVVLIVISLSIFGLIAVYKYPAKEGDARRAVLYIQKNEVKGEPILVFPRTLFLEAEYYYGGYNKLIYIPDKPFFVRWDPSDAVVDNSKIVESAISINGNLPETFWYLTNDWIEFFGINIGREIVEDYINTHYSKIKEEKFYGSSVYRYRKK